MFFRKTFVKVWKLEVFLPRARSERATAPFWCLKGRGSYWKIWKRQCNWILLNLAGSIILIEPDPWKDFGKNRSGKKNLTGIWVHRSQHFVSKWFNLRFFFVTKNREVCRRVCPCCASVDGSAFDCYGTRSQGTAPWRTSLTRCQHSCHQAICFSTMFLAFESVTLHAGSLGKRMINYNFPSGIWWPVILTRTAGFMPLLRHHIFYLWISFMGDLGVSPFQGRLVWVTQFCIRIILTIFLYFYINVFIYLCIYLFAYFLYNNIFIIVCTYSYLCVHIIYIFFSFGWRDL